MSPTPLTTALPKLAAQIDAERPFISAALLDLRVTQIDDTVIHTDVITQHSYDILTSASQQDYLDGVLSRHFNRPTTFSFSLNLNFLGAPSLPVSQSPSPQPPPRTNNTLTFSQRANLQHWMNQEENKTFVATESDALAAGKATGDLKLDITAGNISSMRKLIGIEKIKPVALRSSQSEGGDIDLVALHAKVAQHDLQLDPIAGISLADALTKLRDTLHALEKRIEALESANN